VLSAEGIAAALESAPPERRKKAEAAVAAFLKDEVEVVQKLIERP
jgi:hypothetical protein